MKHLNDDVMVAISIKVTEKNPDEGQLLRANFVALDYKLEIDQKLLPLCIMFKPSRPEELTKKTFHNTTLSEYLMHGDDRYTAARKFDLWFESLNLKQYKKIIPLTWDWPWVRTFLVNWLTYDAFYEYFNTKEYRDLLPITQFINDRAWWHSERYPFPKRHLYGTCTYLDIESKKSNTGSSEVKQMIKAYRAILAKRVPQ